MLLIDFFKVEVKYKCASCHGIFLYKDVQRVSV